MGLYVQALPDSIDDGQWIGQWFGVFDPHNYHEFFLAIKYIKGGGKTMPHVTWRSLFDNFFNVLREIIEPSDDDHVLLAATDVKLILVHEANVSGTQVVVGVLVFTNYGSLKDFFGQIWLVPVPQAFAFSTQPHFADLPFLECVAGIGVHNSDDDIAQCCATVHDVGTSIRCRQYGQYFQLVLLKSCWVNRYISSAVIGYCQRVLGQTEGSE